MTEPCPTCVYYLADDSVPLTAENALVKLTAVKEGLRGPLNPMEEARAIAILVEKQGGKKVASLLEKSKSYVSRRSRLVELHPDFQEALAKGDVDVRAAEQLLTLSPEAAKDESLRRSLIASKTVRSIKIKVAAANAAVHNLAVDEEGEFIEEDPLLLVLREETGVKMAMAITALNELEKVYQQVDEKPPLAKLREAIGWIVW